MPPLKFKIDPERCKGCGICLIFCPKRLLSQTKELNQKGYHLVQLKSPQECTQCALCALMCPEVAISIG